MANFEKQLMEEGMPRSYTFKDIEKLALIDPMLYTVMQKRKHGIVDNDFQMLVDMVVHKTMQHTDLLKAIEEERSRKSFGG